MPDLGKQSGSTGSKNDLLGLIEGANSGGLQGDPLPLEERGKGPSFRSYSFLFPTFSLFFQFIPHLPSHKIPPPLNSPLAPGVKNDAATTPKKNNIHGPNIFLIVTG